MKPITMASSVGPCDCRTLVGIVLLWLGKTIDPQTITEASGDVDGFLIDSQCINSPLQNIYRFSKTFSRQTVFVR